MEFAPFQTVCIAAKWTETGNGAIMSSNQMCVMLVGNRKSSEEVLIHALYELRHIVVARADIGDDLATINLRYRPDIIIINVDKPTASLIGAVHKMSQAKSAPIILFSETGDETMTRDVLNTGISAYVVDGLLDARIKDIIDIAVARFEIIQSLHKELMQTKATLASRKDIERAKGIIMKRRNCDEQDAYATLRKMAMNDNKRIADVARNIISVAGLLE
jgi:response regulator NasT